MPVVARNFDTIDADHKGFVTLPEIRPLRLSGERDRTAPADSPPLA